MGKMRRLVAVSVAAVFMFLMLIYVNSANAAPHAERSKPRGPAVIVLPFQINGGAEAQQFGEELPELLSRRLASMGVMALPPSKVKEIIAKYKINTSDPNTLRAFARAAKASHIIYGSFNEVGDNISFDARMLAESGSGEAVPVYVEKKGMANASAGLDELASRIASSTRNRQVLSGIEVRGVKNIDPDVILTRISLRKGDPVDPQMVDQEVKKVWDLGYFSDVQANLEQRPSGLVLVYTVSEKPIIKNIVIEGNKEEDESDILAAMSTKIGSVLNDSLLAQDIQKIVEVYRKDGFYLAKVTYRVEGASAGSSLVISVNEGKKLYIKEINIDGAKELSASDVKSVLALKERGLLSWFTGTGVLREDYLERDSSAISAYYLDHGFLRVTAGTPSVKYEEDGIIVTFPVKEGPRYKLGEVSFEGDLVEPEDKLFELTKLDKMAKDHDFFSLTVMQDDTKKLTDFYGDYGYAYAEITGDPREHPGDAPVVDVIYKISKKQRIYVNTVSIEGNTRTRDNVVLREMRLVDGDMFQGKKLRRSVERLRKLNYFEVADVDMVPTDKDDEVDLKVKLKEKNTGMLSLGIGYSTYSKVGFGGTIMERNLFGKGYSLGFTGSFSDKYNRYVLSFVNPRVYDTELTAALDAYLTYDYYTDFNKKTAGSALNFSYPLGEYTKVMWGYRLENYKLSNVDHDAADAIKDYEGDNWASVVHAGVRRDTTDDMRRPTKGTIIDLSTDYAGTFLGGTDNYIRPVLDTNAFYSLKANHVLHGRFKAGAAFKNSDRDVPVFERFFIGGMGSIRGYTYDQLSPRDPRSGDHIGGDRMAFMNLEYVWTFMPDLGLSIVPFYDMGFNVDSGQTSDYLRNKYLAKSVGLELRWNSPMGDLRLSYGYPLQDVYEKMDSGRFEFSMGQSF